MNNLISTLGMPEMVDVVKRYFKEIGGLPNTDARSLFINENVPAGTGNSKIYEEYDYETFARLKKEGQNSKKSRVGLGYKKSVTARRYSTEVDITWEMRTYKKENDVLMAFKSLGHFIPQRQALNATHVFTFANVTSYNDMDGLTIDTTTGDGLALANAAHKLKFSSTTYTNIVTSNPQFSQTAYEVALLIGSTQTFNNFGHKRVMKYNTVIFGDNPTYLRVAKQMLNSMADPTASQSGVENVYKNAFTIKVLPYLATDAYGGYNSAKINWWFLGAISGDASGWQAYFAEFEPMNLKTPAVGNNGEDFSNDNWTFGVRGSWDICVLSARGMLCSLAS